MRDRVSHVVCRAALAAGLMMAGLASAFGAVYRVTAEGAGSQDGGSWENAKALASAWTVLQDGDELWLKAETHALTATLATDRQVTLRGGFAGTETSADERTGTDCTVFDGAKKYPSVSTGAAGLLEFTATAGKVTLDRIKVTQSYVSGVRATGGASVEFVDCEFHDNGWRTYGSSTANIQGRGLYLSGSATATAKFVRCRISSNRIHSGTEVAHYDDSGCGAYVKTFAKLELTDTVVVSNGLARSSGAGRDASHGGALYVSGAPVEAKGCDFRANGNVSKADGDGGIVYLNGACGGSTFSNCTFVGNYSCTYNKDYVSANCGALVVSLSAAADTCALENCTVAYNFTRGNRAAAGVNVKKGAVTARNTIFWGNLYAGKDTWFGAGDLYVVSGGSATIENCLVGGTDEAHFGFDGTVSAKPVFTGTTLVDDPCFVTPVTDFTALVLGTAPVIPATDDTASYCRLDSSANAGDPAAFDVHLKSKTGRLAADGTWVTDDVQSPAIDAATEDAPFALETEPNGGRANLGAYGGTAAASRSLDGRPSLSAVVLDQSNGTTVPDFTFTLGGEGDFKAKVWLCHGATKGADDSTEGWEHVRLLTEAAGLGDAFDESAKWVYAPGQTISWRVIVEAAGGTASAGGTGTIDAAAQVPKFWTAGGGEGVIHVWAGAAEYGGDGSGGSWRHAVGSLDAALAQVTDARREIWIAGDFASAAEAAACTVAVRVRGGFTAEESVPEERPAGTRSRLDAASVHNCLLQLGHASGQALVERIDFFNTRQHGLYKTGAGSLAVRDCRFEGNGMENTANSKILGRGAYLEGAAGAVLEISNCVFVANRTMDTSDSSANASGCGAYVKTFDRFDLVETLFASNGCRIGYNSGRSTTRGYALYVQDAPVRARCCDFRANVGCQQGLAPSTYNYGSGGIAYICGASGGSSFVNCLWAGNFCSAYSRDAVWGGALEIDLADAAATCALANCTIAYNLGDAKLAAAGLHVDKGTVTVDDSIIYGNSVSAAHNTAGADIYVADADSSVTLRSSLIASKSATYVSSVNGAGIVIPDEGGMVYGDPLFATSVDAFVAEITSTSPGYPNAMAPLTFSVYARNGDFDLHLKSAQGRWTGADSLAQDDVTSPAIDRADQSVPVGLEPMPNGHRANLGRYGTTAEASMSPVGGKPDIAELTVDESYDSTQPSLTVKTGGTGAYFATVVFCFDTVMHATGGTEGWDVVHVRDQVGNGDTLSVSARKYYRKGETVYWRVVMFSADTADVVREGSFVVTGETPRFLGHGGDPAKVVHFRFGAKGLGTGDSWADGVSTLSEALNLVTAERNQIWFCGDLVRDTPPEMPAVVRDVELIGGFTGEEDSADDRTEGVRTTIDGAKLYNCLAAVVIEGVRLKVRDFVFRRSLQSAFSKSGAGNLTVENCRFADNGWFNNGKVGTRFSGGGANVSGGTNEFRNCLFDGNVERTNGTYGMDGCGLYASASILSLADCSFLTNGLASAVATTGADSPRREGCCGTAVYALDCPQIEVRGCRFVGHRGTDHSAGAVFCVKGTTAGSNILRAAKFVNCLFAGNSAVYWGEGFTGITAAPLALFGANQYTDLGTTVEIDRCTFAYNVDVGGSDSAGLLVQGGSHNIYTVTVRNSIFWGNVGSTKLSSVTAADIRIDSNASLDMDYTLIASTGSPHVIGSADKLTFGDHLVTGKDDCFVTPTETFLAALVAEDGNSVTLPTATSRTIYAKDFDFSTLNLHLSGGVYFDEFTGSRRKKGGTSPAVDAGDPESDCLQEPWPNGHRLNLGYYGGTEWATCSKLGLIIFVR